MAGVTWENVADGRAPILNLLAETSAIAAMSVRTVGAKTDAASAFATIGAGNRARGAGDDDAPISPVIDEMPSIRRDNRALHFGAVPGTLGDSLHAAGLRTGIVGNGDGGNVARTSPTRTPTAFERRRSAGLALADSSGFVDVQRIGDELVRKDRGTLNGYSTEPLALIDAARATLDEADVVLVEIADTYREGQVAFASLDEALEPTPTEESVPARSIAIARDDAVLGRIVGLIDLKRDVLLVLGTTGLGPAKAERLTVALMGGFGAEHGGWLTSATTRRSGLVTIADVGPGILGLFGLDAPAVMTGRAFRDEPAYDDERVQRLASIGEGASFHLRWVGKFFFLFVALQLVLYLFAYARLRRSSFGDVARLRAATLAFLALPVASMIVTLVRGERWGPTPVPFMLLGISAVIAFIALKGPWRNRVAGPPAAILGFNVLFMAGDLLTGADGQLSGFMGYSPIVAGRFFGIGNLGLALLGTSAVLVASSLTRYRSKTSLAMIGLFGLAMVLLDGLAILGADFGGVIALIAAFGSLMVMVAGKRLSWSKLLILLAGAGAIAGAIGFADSLRPEQLQTHVGRFFSVLIKDGPGGVSDVLIRKAAANWSILTNSVLSLSIPIAVAFTIFVLLRPRGRLRSMFDTHPELRAGLTAALILNVVGFAVNDSGVAIPAMGLGIAVPYALATVLALR